MLLQPIHRSEAYNIESCTVIVVYIYIMKTNFYINFDLYQSFKQHRQTHKHVNRLS